MRGTRVLLAAAVAAIASVAWARPLFVGISEQRCADDRTASWSIYATAFEKAGYVPVIIPCTTNAATIGATVARLDMLLVTGGDDVDPARYHTPKSPACGKSDLVRDAFEFGLVESARRHRLPIVGICRGLQLLNVSFGGTLWQDLPSEFPSDKKVSHSCGDYLHPEKFPAAHTVLPVDGTRLADALGSEPLAVNSHHHQAVKDLAPGLRVAARAPDGVVEAVEGIDYPVFAVQFHPEAVVLRCAGHAEYDYPRFEKLLRELPRLCGMEVKK